MKPMQMVMGMLHGVVAALDARDVHEAGRAADQDAAGELTKDGKTLAFSVLSNLGNAPVRDIKKSVVEFLKAIH